MALLVEAGASQHMALMQAVQAAVPGHAVSSHEAEGAVDAPAFAAALDVSCADGVGLIARVTEYVHESGLSLSKLETKTEGAPHGGTQLFSLSAILLSKDRVNEAKLARGFKDLEFNAASFF
jgi:glycine cleavage system regulatory protein